MLCVKTAVTQTLNRDDQCITDVTTVEPLKCDYHTATSSKWSHAVVSNSIHGQWIKVANYNSAFLVHQNCKFVDVQT